MEKPRDIYDYRAGWLDRMCDRFGGTVRFADLVQKNPKHVSAMRSRKKAMGTKVARDIEAALAKARPDMADTLPGLFDTDPSAAPRPVPAYAVKTDLDPPEDGDITIDVPDVEIAAGGGAKPIEWVETLFRHTYRHDWLRSKGVRDPGQLRRCRVRGDSMERLLFHGDMVTFDAGNTRIVDDGVYAILVGGDQLRVKRLRRRRDGGLTIISDNPAYSPEEVEPADLGDIVILGRVIDRSGSGGLGL